MHLRAAAAIASLGALCGCASTPQLASIRDGTAVSIEVSTSTAFSGATTIENKALGHDTSAGAGTGAVAGGLWGLVCGPFAVICVPAGAALGALTGSVAGAGVGLTGALSEAKTEQLRDRLRRALAANPPVDELRRNVADRASLHWKMAGADASDVVTMELKELVLTSTRDEQIGFVAYVLVSARRGGAGGPVTQKTYKYAAPDSSLDIWLDEHNDFIDTSIRVAMQQLATQIVSELARG